jgi:hypothetical protein
MNPSDVAKARTARLAREATTPVYSTSTPAREHLYVAEVEDDYGRHWTKPMTEANLNKEVDTLEQIGYWISDWDHAARCWCFKA